MATKKSTGITPTMVKYGGGISAVRALPKAKGKRPAVIILHERYGIDQHTKDLTVKLAQAGFVGLAPDLFHRFTGDRKAVLRGEQRVDLTDEGALEDLNGAVEYLKKLKEVDGARIGIIGVCQTGRQPVLLAAKRNDVAGAVVLYGAVGGREWQGNELRPTPIEELIAQVNCPVLGRLRRSRPHHLPRRCPAVSQLLGKVEEELSYSRLSRRTARLAERHHAGALPQGRGEGRLEPDHVVSKAMLCRRLEQR